MAPATNLPPILLVINENLRRDVTTDVVDTGGKFAADVNDPSDQFAAGVVDRHQWCTLSCKHLRKFSKFFKKAQIDYQGPRENDS
jgi:hypothetical protein